MPQKKYTVVFEPDGVAIDVFREGENLLRLAIAAGVHINASCGGAGTCGKCKVKILEGRVESKPTAKLTDEQLAEGYRLACLTQIWSDLKVEIPIESRHQKGVLNRQHSDKKLEHVIGQMKLGADYEGVAPDPMVKKLFMDLPAPTGEDNVADMARVGRSLKRDHGVNKVSTELRALRTMPTALREEHWKATASVLTLAGRSRLLRVEPGDRKARQLCAAVDIGTTTIHVQLLDAVTGEKLARSADYNSQVSMGEDVISRIIHATKPGGLESIQKRAIKTINSVLHEVFQTSGADRNDLTHMVFAGNTTMTQLFLGLNPKYIREAPYVPVANYFSNVYPADLGVEVPDHVTAYVMPCVASYVGGDITAGVLATELHLKPELTLFMDVGTNGEIVVGNKDWMVSASASAGPAFEGGGVKFGMRASYGAIEQVRISPEDYEPMIITIGQIKPKGICGSGMIDCIAELQMAGLISQNGKFNQELSSATKRVRDNDGVWEYVVSWSGENELGEDIAITETDIDNLVRTKASIYSACAVLLKSVGLHFTDVEKIIIAGGFGQYIDVEKAMTIGLLPEVDPAIVCYGGNTSLEGCRLACLYADKIDEVEAIAGMITNIELSVSSMYMDEYVAALFLPHTRMEEFPARQKRLNEIRKTFL